MKERPILMSAPMVRAILDGCKTQTRRVVKPQPDDFFHGIPMQHGAEAPMKMRQFAAACLNAMASGKCKPGSWTTISDKDHDGSVANIPMSKEIVCPYGVPGDRLWVRESWGLHDTQPSDGPDNAHVYYRATDETRRDLRHQLWRVSIHMPRWASRLTLEVVSVRVERVRDISEADAVAESFCETFGGAGACHERTTARENFLDTFFNLNKRAKPDANPWVWVVEFKRVEPSLGAGSPQPRKADEKIGGAA